MRVLDLRVAHLCVDDGNGKGGEGVSSNSLFLSRVLMGDVLANSNIERNVKWDEWVKGSWDEWVSGDPFIISSIRSFISC